MWLKETISIHNMTAKIMSDMIIIESLLDCGYNIERNLDVDSTWLRHFIISY